MRIKLKSGKQKELIALAKENTTWKSLGSLLNLNPHYLSNELKKEKRLLSEVVYNKLCNLVNTNYNNHIIEKYDENWGKSKGGKNSIQRAQDFLSPSDSSRLAELFGIILGDGHVEFYEKGKSRCYSVKIAGDLNNDFDYITTHIKNLLEELTQKHPTVNKFPKENCIKITVHGKKMVEFIIKKGIKSGNKKSNNQDIPDWIKKDRNYLKACLRGLIDTDGSIHLISKNNRNLRLSFTSYIPNLLKDVRNSFVLLSFHPSKIIKEKQIFLTRKEDIKIYMETIGFSNQKHLKRYQLFTDKAPVE